MSLDRSPPQCALTEERLELLRQLDDWLDTPMLVLASAWLLLLVVELVWGLTPLLETIGTAIWATFLAVSPCRLPQPTYSHVIAQLWYAYPHCPMILMAINAEITISPLLRSAGGA